LKPGLKAHALMALLDVSMNGIGAAERKAKVAVLKPQRIAEFKWGNG
jgi:hypothetical protein